MRKIKFITAVVISTALMVSTAVSAYATCGQDYETTNSNAQNYTKWSTPIESYLTETTDGKLMRVQKSDDNTGILVEYYTKDYKLQESRIIDDELPIFGGFYATDENYYILSGQNNSEKDDTVEVLRLTKYDKDWNRIASASEYGANTKKPFDAGSARMTHDGKYLFIRTCHLMYSGHQANYTIQVDTEQMKVTSAFSGVYDSTYGYISHSFNQFIKIDNGQLVGVDHGDYYPRAFILQLYTGDYTNGNFISRCQTKRFMTFQSHWNSNETGASAGGFEISDSAYLLAGNTVSQENRDIDDLVTRNIFVAAISKDSKELTTNWITTYKEGETGTSTPQFVKIGENEYMLLWTRNGMVNYTRIDGNGNQTGKIYEMSGDLSDCVPIVVNGKLVWYVCKNDDITFYEINLANPASTNKTEVERGHDYKVVTMDEKGYATLKCRSCGHQTQRETADTIYLKFYMKSGNNFYGINKYTYQDLKPGDRVYAAVSMYNSTSSKVYHDKYTIEIDDKDVVQYCEPQNGESYFSFVVKKFGSANITVRSEMNDGLYQTYQFIVPFYCYINSANNTISSFQEGTTVSDIAGKYTGPVQVKDRNDKVLDNSSKVGTGYKVTEQETGKVYTTILRGDINGDAIINVLDMEAIQKSILGISPLTGVYEQASDIDKDDQISVLDMEAIQKHVLGIEIISR